MSDNDIADSLLEYLRSATASVDLAYREAPARMSGGHDAVILRFGLKNAPEPLSGPLVLRLLPATAPAERVPREAAVHDALAAQGYPAPRVFVAETRAEPLGGSFLIMERMQGRPLGSELEVLSVKGFAATLNILRQLPRIRRELLKIWDEAQARLHALSVDAFVTHVERAGVFGTSLAFEAHFIRLRAAVEELELGGLRPAIEWLTCNRPPSPQPSVICHGDFQPLNVLADQGRLTGVIDWVKAAIAEPAFDYGAARTMLATIPIHVPLGLNRILRAVMNNLTRTHARRCHDVPGGDNALRYYQVFNCTVQLVTTASGRAQGRKTAYNSRAGVANLIEHVRRLTGIEVSLG